MPDDIDDDTEQLKAYETEQKQNDAQRERQQAVTAELPGQTKETAHQFRSRILALLARLWRRVGHPADILPWNVFSIQRKGATEIRGMLELMRCANCALQ